VDTAESVQGNCVRSSADLPLLPIYCMQKLYQMTLEEGQRRAAVFAKTFDTALTAVTEAEVVSDLVRTAFPKRLGVDLVWPCTWIWTCYAYWTCVN